MQVKPFFNPTKIFLLLPEWSQNEKLEKQRECDPAVEQFDVFTFLTTR